MASDRQIAANQANARRSTGPTSEAGKARSRMNAMTHGMTSEVVIAASAAFIERKVDWQEQFQPDTPEAKYALDRAVVASFRIEQCENTFDAMVVEQTTRAGLAWDVDRRVAASLLADKLSKKPDLITTQLEATRHGCEWKIAMWNSLGQTVLDNGEWTEAQATIVLDLLGVASALRTGRTVIDAPENSDVRDHQIAITAREISRLNTLNETSLIAIDASDREMAEQASLALLSSAAQRLHRYEREAWKRLRDSMKIARKRSESDPEVVNPPKVKPDPEPLPETSMDDDVDRQEAVVACYEEAERQMASTRTPEEQKAILGEMYKKVARLKDRRIPFVATA